MQSIHVTAATGRDPWGSDEDSWTLIDVLPLEIDRPCQVIRSKLAQQRCTSLDRATGPCTSCTNHAAVCASGHSWKAAS